MYHARVIFEANRIEKRERRRRKNPKSLPELGFSCVFLRFLALRGLQSRPPGLLISAAF
jgi:hypothetical protein